MYRKFSQPDLRPRPSQNMRDIDEHTVGWVFIERDGCRIATAHTQGGHWARWISCDGKGWRFLTVSSLRWHDGTKVNTASAMIAWLKQNAKD